MSRLFWRIFFSFGAAMAIILVVAITVTFRLAAEIRASDPLGGRNAAVRQAAQALEEGGRDGLRDWLRRNPRLNPRSALLIVDERGEDILGREVPRRVRPLVRGRRHSDGPPPPRNYRPSRFVPQLVATDGTTYRLLTAPVGPSLFGILGWPRARLVWLITALLVTGMVSWLLARTMTAPIGRLQSATRALAAGRLNTRIGDSFAGRRDAIADLAADFDVMAAQLEHLMNQREVLLRDISHELRSPLTRLRMALALAQRRDAGAAAEQLARIEMEAERLAHLIDQVLELARLDTANSAADREQVEVKQVVDGVVADACYEHPDREIRWESEASGIVLGDRAALGSAVENVLRNALAHSPVDQTVEVTLRPVSGNKLELRVQDRGSGVPEADLTRIFEPFVQVEPSRGHEGEGFGVGLAISARLIRMHGGTIVASNRVGGGLTVIITLPAADR